MSEPDYSAFVSAPTDSGGELSRLNSLAERQAEAEADLERIEAELSSARKKLTHLSEVLIPAAMDEVNLSEFATSSGLKIIIAETIRASIPKARSEEAFQWLREHGQASLIKRSIVILYGKGEDEKASEALGKLHKLGLDAEESVQVHPQTLAAFVREQLQEGADIPLELLGVFRQRASKIEVPREPRGRKAPRT